MNAPESQKIRFADFELDPVKRLLFKAGDQVALNSKTFDLLQMLAGRHGEVVSKEELIDGIWAGQFVEESNLTVQISTLRKLLGETRGENRFIVTVPGKGYKFVGEQIGVVDEITIENHSYSRIVVEEEVDDDAEFDERREPLQLSAPERRTTRHRLLTAMLLIVAVLSVTGSVFLWRRGRSAAGAQFEKMQMRQLTNKGNVTLAALSPDGKLFAYTTNEFGKESLWLGQADGGDNIMLRPPAETEYFALAFTPAGDKLLYSIKDWSAELPVLLRMPVFGGASEKIADGVALFVLSADGSQIATAKFDPRFAANQLFVTDVASGERRAVPTPPQQIAVDSLSFSPDGARLAFGSAGNVISQALFTVRIADGVVERIGQNDFGQIRNTAWTADGSAIVVTALETHTWSAVPKYRVWSLPVGGGPAVNITSDLSSYTDALSISNHLLLTIEQRQVNNIWVAPAGDLSSAKQVTTGSFGKYDGLWGLDWTPDDHLVFNSSDTESQVISTMNADGTGQRRLTSPGFVESDLDVSADGRYIVFHSTRGGGGFDIWRMDANGGDPRQLTFDKQSYQPFISPDSKFVYYKSMADGVGRLHRVSIDGGEPVAITEKETSWCTISPDGRLIAALYKTDRSRLAIFDIAGGEPLRQFDLPKTATAFGGIRWTPDGTAVVYHDYDFGYWQQNAFAGPPEKIANLPKEKLYNFAWSRDGSQFAYVRGQQIRDVVLFTDTP
ncbi:MAG: winged helix-turn-helix domain-containing protein [Acidobacteriota bacterium]